MRGVKEDLTGKRFGRWLVLSRVPRVPGKTWDARYMCRCDCGTEKVLYALALRSGQSTSCGCYAKEVNSRTKATHGDCRGVEGVVDPQRTKEYISWISAKDRCFNGKCRQFKYYGGRGITMCEGWRSNFAAFLNDMGRRTTPKHSINRVDPDGHYSCGHCDECVQKGWPFNCEWATAKRQAETTRKTIAARKRKLALDIQNQIT
jgi:hypothetical protein